ncbi:unnamed protein product [Protopolystoma xenopodis]|uniref:Uncharacterized protein n=1 Tax=Protopolystoma xenopodis TaxID=117903 RepID=A0A3S4ZFV2_9PLAT|nr:unnamed protein product [Protopolystoma xenopodis]
MWEERPARMDRRHGRVRSSTVTSGHSSSLRRLPVRPTGECLIHSPLQTK